MRSSQKGRKKSFTQWQMQWQKRGAEAMRAAEAGRQSKRAGSSRDGAIARSESACAATVRRASENARERIMPSQLAPRLYVASGQRGSRWPIMPRLTRVTHFFLALQWRSRRTERWTMQLGLSKLLGVARGTRATGEKGKREKRKQYRANANRRLHHCFCKLHTSALGNRQIGKLHSSFCSRGFPDTRSICQGSRNCDIQMGARTGVPGMGEGLLGDGVLDQSDFLLVVTLFFYSLHRGILTIG